VLLVEDEAGIRDAVAEFLELRGYAVAVATNGREALDVLARVAADVIVLDLCMPVMTGWQVIEALRRDERLSGIPVVVTSADAGPAGMRVVPKPFHPDALLAEIHHAIAHADA
jgi:CheY-like chemotaxis protein